MRTATPTITVAAAAAAAQYEHRHDRVATPDLYEPRVGHCGADSAGGALSVITGGETTYRSVEYFELDEGGHDISSALGFKRTSHACSNYKDPETEEETIIVAGETVGARGRKGDVGGQAASSNYVPTNRK